MNETLLKEDITEIKKMDRCGYSDVQREYLAQLAEYIYKNVYDTDDLMDFESDIYEMLDIVHNPDEGEDNE